ncbi:MAG TPA: arginine deiminase-related protein [Chitinophagales bacterium]|nr:arginine deiminase-related protein [Chitinophagales bacterium]
MNAMRGSQTTDTILMVRPGQFGFNAETASTNIFQQDFSGKPAQTIHEKALKEFDDFVQLLRDHKIYVLVLQDPGKLNTPDAIFLNNWISFHEDTIVLYPMLAENRRKERRSEWVAFLQQTLHSGNVIDFSGYEKQNQFLEGTGSLVLDRTHKIAYATRSSRTSEKLLNEFADKMSYELVCFTATDNNGNEIYHTNVLMAIGEKTAVICSEMIRDEGERKMVLQKLTPNHELIVITSQQLLQFAGNMLLVKNRDGEKFWVMSEQAFHSLTDSQIDILEKDGGFIHSPLKTIETTGGGSARCMMAEIF